MALPRLDELSRLTGAPLEDVALAIAAEFKPVRVAEAQARLDALARPLGQLATGRPEVRATALVEAVRSAGYATEGDEHPRSLMFDDVLATHGGHPLALAIVHVAVARRAGFALFPVGNERAVLLADRATDPPLVIDPVPDGGSVSVPLHWLCPHLVALRMIEAIGCRYMRRGDLANGIRAAELRTMLPLNSEARERHAVALRSLRARLN